MTRMDLIRWEPFLRDTIAGRFNPFFSSSWPTPGQNDLSRWSPPVDIYDTGTALVLEADLPGFQQDDIDIRLENNVLMLSGERRHETEGPENYFRAERTHGSFSRSFALPTTVDPEKIEARYRDGILTLTMPKVESAIPRRIDVQFH